MGFGETTLLIFIGLLNIQRVPSSIMLYDRDLPCASGVSSIPPFDQLTILPQAKFPPIVPSGVNLCDWSCGGVPSKCTYNWGESLMAFPVLLFRCWCPTKAICPKADGRYEGYLSIKCQVATSESRCICPYGKNTFQCNISALPVSNTNPYYCVCCD